MTNRRLSNLLPIIALIAIGSSVELRAAEPAAEGEWTPLFNGKTFDGWEGDLKVFRIEDGAIVGGSLQTALKHNEFLATAQEYGDFELRLQVKLVGPEASANGGVQIRSRRIPNNFEMIGYQADMGQQYWGCLYDESRRHKILAGPKPDELAKVLKRTDWNDYVIRCQGRHVELSLNGLKTVDYTEPDEKLEQRGLIGLQIHSGPASEAWYREIKIRKL